ncbi:DsbA family oxidoreductase [Paenibacillus methanolicus]|uniref:Putative DsbA family dithiol-disulfide isomerase n=1 Tax=Paenibacillus methanolicus TaxID=582686 RepID=A0A5S5CB78_9BACL|nr:DsbA family oxidoreductase [Paenibacillus methanolicus]TYP75606.1 putative DsbA family dithiol-disulfide isomerase [Paenibacillus methanolicus]
MHIDFYYDLFCPWCRIGHKHLLEAIDRRHAQGGEPVILAYRSYQLDPSLPPEGMPFRHAAHGKAGEALRQVSEAGEAAGLPFRFDLVTRMPNTRLAHRFVALLPEPLKPEAIEALFRAVFEEGRDIAACGEIETIAASVGAEAVAVLEALRRGDGEDRVSADIASAARLGVKGGPLFVFGDRFALSGAYPPDKLLQAMSRAAQG